MDGARARNPSEPCTPCEDSSRKRIRPEPGPGWGPAAVRDVASTPSPGGPRARARLALHARINHPLPPSIQRHLHQIVVAWKQNPWSLRVNETLPLAPVPPPEERRPTAAPPCAPTAHAQRQTPSPTLPAGSCQPEMPRALSPSLYPETSAY
ncbi:hypothetical protein Naga_101268g2, partial [Nannochloropsis gaditana]